jgi:CrcB protein
MTGGLWPAFLIAAVVGACARYLLDTYVTQRVAGPFPWGTGLINLSGSFVLGVITGAVLYHGVSPDLRLVLGTGFCGGYTTFSTFSFETIRLLETGQARAAVGNVVLNTAGGLLLAGAGLALAAWV